MVEKVWDADSGIAEAIEDAKRPIVRIRGGDLVEVIDRAEAHLIAHDPNIFHFDQQLVAVRPKLFKIADGKKATGLRALPLTVNNLIEKMTATSNFRKFVVRTKDWRSVNCPELVAHAYLERRQQWEVPLLTGVATCPILCPDGRIIEQSGYDAETGIYYDPQGIEFPAVPSNPSRDQALAALRLHRELVKDFPFVDEVSRAVAVAQTLTLLARHCFPHAPLFAGSATSAGSGKTLLQNLASIIATGSEASLLDFSPDPEEFKKLLGAVLPEASPVLLLDNIESGVALQGTVLCKAITEDTINLRILGQSRTVDADTTHLTFFANGNNLALHGDITRRALRWELDPKCENPELRELDESATLAQVKRRRPELVAAGLTVLRYYLQAGSPDPVALIGSFEPWCRLIPSALRHLGMEDATASLRQLRRGDPGRSELAAVLVEWRRQFGDIPAGSTEAIARAGERTSSAPDADPAHPLFRDLLLSIAQDGRSDRISKLRLSKWLSSHRGEVVQGHRFVTEEYPHTKVLGWRAQKL